MEQIFLLDTQQKNLRTLTAKRLKINDTISNFLAVIGIIIAYFENEDFYGTMNYTINSSNAVTIISVENQYIEKTYNRVLRLIIGASSVFLCLTIYFHYRLKISFLKLKQKLDSNETLKSTGMIWFLCFELLICIIHCPPGCNWVFTFQQYGGTLQYSFDMFTFLVMLGRIYLF